MELKRYWHDRHEREYVAIQLTADNMKEIARHLELEYVEDYFGDDGLQKALFRTGYSVPIFEGYFVAQLVRSDEQAYALTPKEFAQNFHLIETHVYVPTVFYSEYGRSVPCVFCGHDRHGVPYHRDALPGETVELPDGGTLKLNL